jgi:hypothetical protein
MSFNHCFIITVKIYKGEQVKGDEMGSTCSMHRQEMHTKIWSENLKGRDHSDDIGVDGTIILEQTFGK